MIYPRDAGLGVLMTHWTKETIGPVCFFWNPQRMNKRDMFFRHSADISPSDLHSYGKPVGPTELCKWND
jgi:hypothetical protein